jgi:hypothetical protein
LYYTYPGFSLILRFPPRRGDMVLNVSNDEPTVVGETDELRQLREQHNANCAEHRQHEAEEEETCRRGPRPRDLANAFDRVGDRQVFRTPSANVAIVVANLDRLPDMAENHAVREDIKAYLTVAMGQTVELAQRARAATSTSIASSRSHRSCALEHLSH